MLMLTEHTAGPFKSALMLTKHTAGPFAERRTDQFQRRASQLWTGPSPAEGRRQGGGERGKFGPRDGISYKTADRLSVSNQRLPEILDG